METNLTDQFFSAIKEGNGDQVKALAAQHPELLKETEEGVSALSTAKYYRKQDIVDLLVDLGAPVDVFTAATIGKNAIVLQAIEDNPDIVRRFSPDGWTLLHLAAFFGHANLIQPLLAAGSDVNARSQNSQGNTPLHASLPGSHTEIVKALLDGGADIDARQVGGGYTPLHEAAVIGNLDLARLLLDHGADLSATTDKNETALDLARTRGTETMVAILDSRAS